MSSRISATFQRLREAGKGGFIAYVTAGDPDTTSSLGVLQALDRAGTDIIELGIPFSDPLADGPTIQAATGRALAAGMSVSKALELIRSFREASETPIVIFTYLNPVFTFGYKDFLAQAAAAGADGILILDLPPDHAPEYVESPREFGLDLIRLIAPTTSEDRIPAITATGSGFIYYVCREGVTGEQQSVAEGISEQVEEIRKVSSLPVAVGFGISTPEQAAAVAASSDAAVVGSAIVRRIGEWGGEANLAERVEAFVKPLAEAASKRATAG